MRRIEKLKTREILRLKHEVGLSLREIAKSCNCGKTSVSEVLERAEKAGVHWPIELSDKQLLSLLYPPLEQKNTVAEPDIEYVFYEMKKKHVTLMLLWEEYKEKHPDGIMYTQFYKWPNITGLLWFLPDLLDLKIRQQMRTWSEMCLEELSPP